jgi:hypothetical protein
MKLSLFITISDTCYFSNVQKIFLQYKTNSGRYVKHTEKLFTDRFADVDDEDRGLFKRFANPSEVSYEDAEPASQLGLIDLRCSDELRSKFKEGDMLNFYKVFF